MDLLQEGSQSAPLGERFPSTPSAARPSTPAAVLQTVRVPLTSPEEGHLEL